MTLIHWEKLRPSIEPVEEPSGQRLLAIHYCNNARFETSTYQILMLVSSCCNLTTDRNIVFHFTAHSFCQISSGCLFLFARTFSQRDVMRRLREPLFERSQKSVHWTVNEMHHNVSRNIV